MADIQRYLDKIASQHKGKPKFMGMVSALLSKVDDASACVKGMPGAFEIVNAEGEQLDVLGQLMGIDRRYDWNGDQMTDVTLGDEDFRSVIQMQTVSARWDGTMENYMQLWRNAVGYNLDARIVDNQDMTVDINLTGEISYDLIRLIQRGYFIPEPMGVGVNINVTRKDYSGMATAWQTAGAVSIYAEYGATAINIAMEG